MANKKDTIQHRACANCHRTVPDWVIESLSFKTYKCKGCGTLRPPYHNIKVVYKKPLINYLLFRKGEWVGADEPSTKWLENKKQEGIKRQQEKSITNG